MANRTAVARESTPSSHRPPAFEAAYITVPFLPNLVGANACRAVASDAIHSCMTPEEDVYIRTWMCASHVRRLARTNAR
jgi:hypothetical protein